MNSKVGKRRLSSVFFVAALVVIVLGAGASASPQKAHGPVHHVVNVSDSFPVTDGVSVRLGHGCSPSGSEVLPGC